MSYKHVDNAGYDSKQDKKLKDNKSPGIYGITPKLLKEIAEDISVPLAIMFNLSLREGAVPHKWKHANVVPIFKKGNRCKAENYRPVSLTPIVCTLLESLLRDHVPSWVLCHPGFPTQLVLGVAIQFNSVQYRLQYCFQT